MKCANKVHSFQVPDNVTIYISDPSLLGSKLFKQIKGIRSYEGLNEGDSATGIRFKLDAGQVTMNFMPEKQIEEHLQGFCGYAEHVTSDKDKLPYILTWIQNVRFALGCVIEPGFDDAGKIQEFLFQFNAALNGLLFLVDTVFDHDGEPLAGPLADEK